MIGCHGVKEWAWSLPGSQAEPVNPSVAVYLLQRVFPLMMGRDLGLGRWSGLQSRAANCIAGSAKENQEEKAELVKWIK